MVARVYDYTRLRSTAKKLVEKFGVLEVEIRLAGGAGRYTAAITFEEYKSFSIDGSRVKAGDFRGLIADASIEPLSASPPLNRALGEGDQLFWGGRLRQIVSGSLVRPGNASILHTVQIRGPR